MKIKEIASQFTVMVLSTNVDRGAAIKVALAQAGYDAFFISDLEVGLKNIQQSNPHIVIIELKSLPESLSTFVGKILAISGEIRLVLLGNDSEFETLAKYEDHGVVQILSEATPFLEGRLVWAVNRICESLYLTYQNEELLKRSEQAQAELTTVKEAYQLKIRQSVSFRGIDVLIHSYKTCETKEQVLNLFFDQLAELKVLYFKYLPTVRSLIVTHSSGYLQESIQGVGCQLPENENQDLVSQLSLGVCPGSLAVLMKRALGLAQVQVFPVFSQNDLEGVIVADVVPDSEFHRHLSEQFALFGLAYSHFAIEKKIELVDMQDSVTEVFNAKYYNKRLSDEVQRARRQKQPLSVVKIGVDDIDEITQTLGSAVRDHVLKMVAQLMVKSSRAHDFVARLRDNELVLVLVNCSKRGAGLRADRLRRAVESSSVLDHGIKLSISIGVSEYPSLCDSFTDLDETSTQALMHIYAKGGNRLCLYKAVSGFKPEFEIAEASGEPHVP